MDERQQDGFELDTVPAVDDALDGQEGDGTLLGDGGQVPFEDTAVLVAPAVEEVLAAQLRAEQLAQPRAGEAELVAPLSVRSSMNVSDRMPAMRDGSISSL